MANMSTGLQRNATAGRGSLSRYKGASTTNLMGRPSSVTVGASVGGRLSSDGMCNTAYTVLTHCTYIASTVVCSVLN